LPCGVAVDALAGDVGDVELRRLVDALFAVGPFDLEAFLLEQALVVGDEFGKALERCSRLKPQGHHGYLPKGHWLELKSDQSALTSIE
jgi:hypothetical protein